MQQEQRVNQNQKSSRHLFAGLHFSRAGTMIARVVWVVFAIGLLVLSAGSLLADYAQAQIPCHGSNCAIGQITVGNVMALHRLGLSIPLYELYPFIFSLVVSGILFLVSCVIFWRRSDQWFPYFVSLWLLVGAAVPIVGPYSSLFPSQVMGVIANGLVIVLLTAFGVFCVTFPNGQFAPRWSWLIPLLWILQLIAFLAPPPFNITNWPGPLFPLEALLVYGSTLVLQVYRYKQVYTRAERQQTKWLVYGLAIAVLYVLCFFVLSAVLSPDSPILLFLPPVPLLLALCVGLAVGAAVLRYHLWDIDLIINRTLVYGALSASVIGLYVLIVGYFGAVFRTTGSPVIALIATALVAIVFQPLRGLLQRAVNRLMYGERDDPYLVISRLGKRLEEILAPDAVLPTIVETVVQALKLPYAAISLKQGEELVIVASHGSPKGDIVRLPLVYQAEQVGELDLAPRAPGERFTPADYRLLNDLARQAGIAAHAVRLTADLKRLTITLQEERERLVTAREEERRHLRRDLHDGLGPTLGHLTLQLDGVSDLIAQNPSAAMAQVAQLKANVQDAMNDIRRLVYSLRPPALDELGLVTALREQVAQYHHAGGLTVTVEAPASLPALPAAVEVAAYRIALEALTNVVRHAQARTCCIILTITDELVLDIEDDGKGLPDRLKAGIGLLSMRERAAELGGTCIIEARPEGGMRVHARLPLAKE